MQGEDRKSEYSPDEERVAQWFFERGVGGGDDPIGAMIRSHELLAAQRDLLRAALSLAREDLRSAITHIDRELDCILGSTSPSARAREPGILPSRKD